MAKINLYNLGCKLNYAEINELSETLENQGHNITEFNDNADFYIINACSVTQIAEKKTRQIIHQASKNGIVIITGCVCDPQIKNNYIFEQNKDKIPEIIKRYILENKSEKAYPNTIKKSTSSNRTRAFIKIQTGCDNFCSYCIIPYLRGKPTNEPLEKILKKILEKQEKGYKEIILTGVNIAKYQDKDFNLKKLIQYILEKTSIPRIRLGSIDPNLIDSNFLSLFKNKRLCNHIHLSTQSGCNKILKKMNRKYTAKTVKDLVIKLREINKDFGITTDIITGFPTETDEDFIETKKFMQKIRFSKSNIFPFSPRKGTLAYDFKPQIDHKIKKARALILRNIDKEQQNKFEHKYINTTQKVLIENKIKDYWHGYTENYIKVKIPITEKDLVIKPNIIIDILIKKAYLI